MPDNPPKKLPPPAIPLRLVEWLEQTFPDRLPRTIVEQTVLAERVGEQNVVKKLRHLYEEQQKPDVSR